MSEVKRRKNSWKGLPEQIWSRVVNAFLSIRFMMMFTLGLFVIAGMGLWIPYLFGNGERNSFLDSRDLFTYGMTVLGTLFVDFCLAKENKDDLGLLAISVGILSMIVLIYGYVKHTYSPDCFIVSGTALAIVLYFFVNVNDERFDSKADTPQSDGTGYTEARAEMISDRESS